MRRLTSTIRGAIVALLGAVVLAGCAAGSASEREDELSTIGILHPVPIEAYTEFVDELRAQGWTLGRNLQILPADQNEVYLTDEEAREALRTWQQDDLDLIIAFSTPFAQLAEDETDLPGLFVVNDPVASGLTTDLHRPDGQLTGLTWRTPADRTLDVASDALGITRIGYLQPVDDAAVAAHRAGVLLAAGSLGIEVVEATFADPDDVDRAVGELADAEVDAVYLSSATAVAAAIDQLEAALDRRRLPTIANMSFVDFAVITLAPDTAELNRQLARQAARLLDGSSVTSVPGEDPRRFLVTINRTRAAAYERTVDDEVLRRADVVR